MILIKIIRGFISAQHLLEKYTYLELIIIKIIIYLRKLG